MKPPGELQCTLHSPALTFLLQECLRFAPHTNSLWKAVHVSHAIKGLFLSRKVLWVFATLQSISDSFSFLSKVEKVGDISPR